MPFYLSCIKRQCIFLQKCRELTSDVSSVTDLSLFLRNANLILLTRAKTHANVLPNKLTQKNSPIATYRFAFMEDLLNYYWAAYSN